MTVISSSASTKRTWILETGAETGEGMEELRELLSGQTCAFTGNSGVGKTSLLNRLDPTLMLRTGEVSESLGRGRHTTRHVELFALPFGGYIADTPGFGSFDVEQMESIRPAQLQYCFPEFAPHLGQCRFNDCTHRNAHRRAYGHKYAFSDEHADKYTDAHKKAHSDAETEI